MSQSLASFLRSARVAKGPRQFDVATEIGVTIQTISSVELGNRSSVAQDILVKIATYLEVDDDEALRLAGFVPDDIREALLQPGAFARVRKLLSGEGPS